MDTLDTIKTVQDLINAKAEKRLNKDIDDYFNQIRGNKLNEGIRNVMVTVRRGDITEAFSLHAFLFDNASPGGALIRKMLLDDYVLEESRKFVNLVVTMDDDIIPTP